MRTMRFFHGLRAIKLGSKSLVIGAFFVGIVTSSAAGALASRSAGDHFVDRTIAKLGGNPEDVLEGIADKVVDRLESKTGGLEGAQKELVDHLRRMAGDKLDEIDPSSVLKDVQGKVVAAGLDKIDELDPSSVLEDVRGSVVAAGLDKIDGFDLKAITDQVTKQIIDQVTAKMAGIDLEELARSVLGDAIEDVNLKKLVNDYLNSIDVKKIVSEVVKEQMASGGGGGLLGGLLFGR